MSEFCSKTHSMPVTRAMIGLAYMHTISNQENSSGGSGRSSGSNSSSASCSTGSITSHLLNIR